MKNMERSVFSLRLISLRKAQRLTQEDMSKMLNVSRSTYTCYEIGTSTPGLSVLSKLADIFHVSVDYLLGRDDYHVPVSMLQDSGLSQDELRVLDCFDKLGADEQHALIELLAVMTK